MTSFAGHISHIYENPNLTFQDLFEIINKLGSGTIEKAIEKFDGANILFTAIKPGEIRVARSKSEIKNGGLGVSELKEKFKHLPNVFEAYESALNVIQIGTNTLTEENIFWIFQGGTRWYSAEVIYPTLSTVINYDKQSIVLHEQPVFSFDGENIVEGEDLGINLLIQYVEQLQKAISRTSWSIHGPQLVKLTSLSTDEIQQANIALQNEIQMMGCGNQTTLGEYTKASIKLKFVNFLSPKILELVASRLAFGFPTFSEIKKIASKKDLLFIKDIVSNEKEIKFEALQPIEFIITSFASQVLKTISSNLTTKNNKEIKRLQNLLSNVAKAIENSESDISKEFLKKQLSRIQDPYCISAIEGIVFRYQGNDYKITGAYAPLNQIVSLFTHKKEVSFSFAGGKNIQGASSLSRQELFKLLPDLIKKLQFLGIKNIELAGSSAVSSYMNDIDIIGESKLYRDQILVSLGSEAKAIGANGISFQHSFNEKCVQVDLFIGDVNYLSWSRKGTSSNKLDNNYSLFKGALRNMFLNKIALENSLAYFSNIDSLQRQRYAIDFDKGLNIINQTKKGKTDNILKNWKTTKTAFVTSNPSEIVLFLLGDGYTVENTNTLEAFIEACRKSNRTSHFIERILNNFQDELEEIELSNKILGSDPLETLRNLRAIIANRNENYL